MKCEDHVLYYNPNSGRQPGNIGRRKSGTKEREKKIERRNEAERWVLVFRPISCFILPPSFSVVFIPLHHLLRPSSSRDPTLMRHHPRSTTMFRRRCARARAPLCYIRRADTFKRVAETRPRLANVVGKGRFSLVDFLPEV